MPISLFLILYYLINNNLYSIHYIHIKNHFSSDIWIMIL